VPRLLFAPVARNHPPGTAKPRAHDVALTRRVVEADQLLGTPVVDPQVVGRVATSPWPSTSCVTSEWARLALAQAVAEIRLVGCAGASPTGAFVDARVGRLGDADDDVG